MDTSRVRNFSCGGCFSSAAVGHKDVHIRFKRANDLMPSKHLTELKFLVPLGCGLAKSAATQNSVSKSAANSATLKRVSFCITELKFLLPMGCGLAKSAATGKSAATQLSHAAR